MEDITCELIREAALEKLREELPHSLAVTVDEISEDGKKIFASLWVERDSQKGILIGKGGQQLKAIGSEARSEIEQRLGEENLSFSAGKGRIELAAGSQEAWEIRVLARRSNSVLVFG